MNFPLLLSVDCIGGRRRRKFLVVKDRRGVGREQRRMEDWGLDPPGRRYLELVGDGADLLENLEGAKAPISHLLRRAVDTKIRPFEVDLVARLVVWVWLGSTVVPTLHVVLGFLDRGLGVFVRSLQLLEEGLSLEVGRASERRCSRVRMTSHL